MGRIQKFVLTMGLVACLNLVSSLAIAGVAVTGQWRFDETGEIISISQCGSDLCATLVGLPEGTTEKADVHNHDPALRTQLLCGLQVVTGVRPSAPDNWADGRGYNPEDGDTYTVSLALAPNGKLKMWAAISGLPFLGQNYWLSSPSYSRRRRP